jgi:hypothetical protein
MSLVIQLNQRTKQLGRLLYVPNNIAEIIESHGSCFLDLQRDYYNHHKSSKKPFNYLPSNYDKLDVEHQIFIYDVERIHQYESVKE